MLAALAWFPLSAGVLAATAAPASADPNARAHRASPDCTFTVRSPFGIGRDKLGDPSYQVTAHLSCGREHWNDVRLCPQQLVNGSWQFVAGSGGWANATGTCRDADWFYAFGTDMFSQFSGTPGQEYRTWARAWLHGVTYTATSAPWVMPPKTACIWPARAQ